MKDLDRAVALEIEAKIVPALNEAWPESHGDEQTWEDKNEAARAELVARYPDESEAQVDAWLDAFAQDYCARPEPYQTAGDDRLKDAAPAMLKAGPVRSGAMGAEVAWTRWLTPA